MKLFWVFTLLCLLTSGALALSDYNYQTIYGVNMLIPSNYEINNINSNPTSPGVTLRDPYNYNCNYIIVVIENNGYISQNALTQIAYSLSYDLEISTTGEPIAIRNSVLYGGTYQNLPTVYTLISTENYVVFLGMIGSSDNELSKHIDEYTAIYDSIIKLN